MWYQDGTGVEQDYAEALRWYHLAADQGHADAQHNIGICYARGTGVAQDDAEAARWFRLAADQGHAGALGLL
jgi:TPR repeat protein